LAVTPGADRAAVASVFDPDLQGEPACLRGHGHPAVDEALLWGDAVEDSLEEHRVRLRGQGGRDNPSLTRGFTRFTAFLPLKAVFSTHEFCRRPNLKKGAKLTITTGKTVTIESPQHLIASPRQTIFPDGDTAGTVAFNREGTVYSEWWGATGNSTGGSP